MKIYLQDHFLGITPLVFIFLIYSFLTLLVFSASWSKCPLLDKEWAATLCPGAPCTPASPTMEKVPPGQSSKPRDATISSLHLIFSISKSGLEQHPQPLRLSWAPVCWGHLGDSSSSIWCHRQAPATRAAAAVGPLHTVRGSTPSPGLTWICF